MKNYEIGDIVKLKGVDGDAIKNTLFIITDILDFSITKNGKTIVDLDIELAQIFPVTHPTKYSTVTQNDILPHAKRATEDKLEIMVFVFQERKAKGVPYAPDYIKVLEENLKTQKEIARMKMRNSDKVRYDKLDSVDECLDAYNDLEELHRMFGDREYLEHIAIVEKRLKDLKD